MSADPPTKIRIAISGGGLAGAYMLRALMPYPHLDAHLFESAPHFKESGIGFGMTRNATTALDLLGPEARTCLTNAGGTSMKGIRIFTTEQDREVLVREDESKNYASNETVTVVQRAHFLRECLAGIPQEQLHVSKRLDKVDQNSDGSLTLHFADKTTHECDLLIGADGIRSLIRRLILGEEDPAAHPSNTGPWCLMTLQPYERARESLGNAAVDAEDPREISWIGDGCYVIYNLLNWGTTVQFIVCSENANAKGSQEWQKKLSRDDLQDALMNKGWPPHIEKAVKELLCDQAEQHAIYLWDHPPARTYVEGPLCVIGDAAHATTPWQGAGGGMCIEDSLILSTLLGRASSRKEALMALQVYDRVRRPHTQQVVASSLETGRMLVGRHDKTMRNPEKLRELMAPRWDFFMNFDVKRHRDEALQLFVAEISQGS